GAARMSFDALGRRVRSRDEVLQPCLYRLASEHGDSTQVFASGEALRAYAVSIEELSVVGRMIVCVPNDAAEALILPCAHALHVPPLAFFEKCAELREAATVALSFETRAKRGQERVLHSCGCEIVETFQQRIHRRSSNTRAYSWASLRPSIGQA